MRKAPRLLALFMLAACGDTQPAAAQPATPPRPDPVDRSRVGAAAPALILQVPVACEVGRTCFLQQYPDHDSGPGAADYQCGPKSYEGHSGTDFRLPSVAAQRAGVAVLAAAEGTVLRVRDGVADNPPGETRRDTGEECGNGLVVSHGGRWETQYCHLKAGSLRVKPGDVVKAGQPLGLIGQSGDAQFPHLHLSVREGGRVADPFAYGAAPGACGGGRSLWSREAAARLQYRAPEVINAGFATGAVPMTEIELGSAGTPAPRRSSPALVAFVRAIGLRQGDAQELTLTAPDGAVVARSALPPLDRAKAQYSMYTGKKSPGSWPAGTYRARYRVVRNQQLVLDRAFTLAL